MDKYKNYNLEQLIKLRDMFSEFYETTVSCGNSNIEYLDKVTEINKAIKYYEEQQKELKKLGDKLRNMI